MKSIDKLRKMAMDFRSDVYKRDEADYVDEIADEIEAEIADNYMRLPVDADGVPIRIGDEIQYVNEQGGTGAKVTVCAISNGYVYYPKGNIIHAYSPESCRHVKPRTLEDVLRDVWKEAIDYAKSDIWRSPDEVVTERAAEIRELMGGGAE